MDDAALTQQMYQSEKIITPSKPRRTQEERRRETQSAVLDACIEVLLDRGFAGLTVAEVAERAGVSRGALAHYFRSRDELINGAMEYAMELTTSTSAANAERAREGDDPVRAFVDDVEWFFLSPTYVAFIELMVASRTRPSLRDAHFDLLKRWRDDFTAIWLEAFANAGIPDDRAWQILHFTYNIFRGVALTSIWNSDRAELDAVVRSWRATVEKMMESNSIDSGRDARESSILNSKRQ